MASHNRRGFLRGLASLPLIGGSVALVGTPTHAAVPVTDDLLRNYESWLAWERYKLHREMWGDDTARKSVTFLAMNTPGEQFHNPWKPGARYSQPSTRAAVILSTAGVPLT